MAELHVGNLVREPRPEGCAVEPRQGALGEDEPDAAGRIRQQVDADQLPSRMPNAAAHPSAGPRQSSAAVRSGSRIPERLSRSAGVSARGLAGVGAVAHAAGEISATPSTSFSRTHDCTTVAAAPAGRNAAAMACPSRAP
jgi:hypothetical protein